MTMKNSDIFKPIKCSHSRSVQVIFARVREMSKAQMERHTFQKGAKPCCEKTFPPLLLQASKPWGGRSAGAGRAAARATAKGGMEERTAAVLALTAS